jgi:uncharacterized membrane protein
MRRISVTAALAAQIALGAKTDTYRGADFRIAAGERVAFCVNAGRPDFAVADVTDVELVDAFDMDADRRALVEQLMGRADRYTRVAFRLVDLRLDVLRAQKLKAVQRAFAAAVPAGA